MNSNSLVDKVAKILLEYITDHKLQVGDRLPNEYQLVEDLGVSRSTVREAIKTLSSKNILEVKRGSGTFISAKMGVSDDPLGFNFVKDQIKLTLDLFEIRYLLEPTIASLAAQNATSEEIEKLEELVCDIEQLIKDENPLHLEKDKMLHALIAEISRNIAISQLIPIINDAIIMYAEITPDRSMEETLESHREILRTIKARDSIGAYDAMLLHMMYNRRVLKNMYKQ
jgi:Transcriptional regulators